LRAKGHPLVLQIAILLYPGLTALDAIGPYEVLRMLPDAELRFVWREPGPVVTDSGVLVLRATHSLEDTPRPDVVLVPGSSGATATTMVDDAVLEWLRGAYPHARLVTSVCSGALVLAAAGLLDGRSATTHWAAMPLLGRFGAKACPQDRVVRDGKIWTAAGVSAGIDLALSLVAELEGEEMAKTLQLMIEYDPRPPFDSGQMSKASTATRAKAALEMARVAARPAELLALPKAIARRWAKALKLS
jgi:transcriptional regulator GlxA family with amidase domain